MRTLVLVIYLIIFIAAGAWSTEPYHPNFSWGSKASPSVSAQLRRSESAWNDAVSVPKTPPALRGTASNMPLDENYLQEIISRKEFLDAAYDLLDAAMRKEERLGESKTLYEKAAAQIRPPVGILDSYRAAFSLRRSYLRLTVGVSRAAISQSMASSSTGSYCFQAMESAIDALRDAASYADQSKEGKVLAESIREFRQVLFDTWERAQKAKDTRIIAAVDLRRVFLQAFPCPPEQDSLKPCK